MSAAKVTVVRTGTANLASVNAGLRRAGADPIISTDLKEIEAASILVLPGVGAFGAIMQQLREHDLVDILRARFEALRPTLCVCLGLQVLAESSEEDPGVEGLGIAPGSIRRFPDTVRVPQLGWNTVTPGAGCELLEPGYAYFANSYYMPTIPDGFSGATCTHGVEFVAAIEHGPILACQFHPELSGKWGRDLLSRWLSRAQQ